MTIDMSIIHLILNASLVVQLVILLLVLASVVSWAMIFEKQITLNQTRRSANAFEERFWDCEDLGRLFDNMSRSKRSRTGMERIFESGYQEFLRLKQNKHVEAGAILDGSQRAMHVAMNKEVDKLETNLSFLATVGSTSPYIGLFGTVWGIMHSFQALGNVQQATIAMVAPGISEALIATAMGLFAAIPAVIAFNRFSNGVENLINRYGNFLEEFSAVLHRHNHDQE